ncbi:hypothetical protein [Hamadaea tsunoensis]|uniref:hypothetical protein n=1 Tax=Hamadaea tsunoensis TaxID=53368 RepID=UPI000429C5D7|nr:hypothetical protein [Hamadaea tsunoensis]
MNLEKTTPPSGTIATCRGCPRPVVWDDVHGWMHTHSDQPPVLRTHHVADAVWPQR